MNLFLHVLAIDFSVRKFLNPDGLIVVVSKLVPVTELVEIVAKVNRRVLEHPRKVLCLFHLFKPNIGVMISFDDFFYYWTLFNCVSKHWNSNCIS